MKKRILLYDPYARIIDKFNRKNIRYVVIGMSGINYYASNVREAFSTLDYDIFLKPTINNIKKAILICKDLDYAITAANGNINNKSLEDVVRSRKTVSAEDPYGIMIELILSVSGFTFNQMENDAKIFMVDNIPIKVAQLRKLIASKKIANRSKDKLFLKRYAILLHAIKEKNNTI